ncbi:hypothetical protein ACJJTC_008957 [Scirpophaga incertulas]
MKTFFVLSCFIAATLAAVVPVSQDLRELPAVRHEEHHDEYGQYALRYITAENTVVSERGRLVPGANGAYVLEIEGQYQFIGDDGKIYTTKYRGGQDGFHVDGSHLPEPTSLI